MAPMLAMPVAGGAHEDRIRGIGAVRRESLRGRELHAGSDDVDLVAPERTVVAVVRIEAAQATKPRNIVAI